MKKLLIIVLIVIICIIGVGCREFAKLIDAQATSAQQEMEQLQPTPEETVNIDVLQSLAEDGQHSEPEEVALVYIDPQINIFIMIGEPGWSYTTELYEGEVYFYPTKDPDGVTAIAISSRPLDECSAQQVRVNMTENMTGGYKNIKWDKGGDVMVGQHAGVRDKFMIPDAEGCFVYWETDERAYMCSMTCEPDEYKSMETLLDESLATFKKYEETSMVTE